MVMVSTKSWRLPTRGPLRIASQSIATVLFNWKTGSRVFRDFLSPPCLSYPIKDNN